jgi:hypothetical protein
MRPLARQASAQKRKRSRFPAVSPGCVTASSGNSASARNCSPPQSAVNGEPLGLLLAVLTAQVELNCQLTRLCVESAIAELQRQGTR